MQIYGIPRERRYCVIPGLYILMVITACGRIFFSFCFTVSNEASGGKSVKVALIPAKLSCRPSKLLKLRIKPSEVSELR